MNVMLTGAGGQLGRCLQERWPRQWRLHALAFADLDITNPQAVDALVRRLKPDLIINAAAYNAVDKAEAQPAQAHAVNALGPFYLAQAAAAVSARLIHVSTDYVFDGLAARPYREEDDPAPLNAYGRSKRAGELAVLGSSAKAMVVRTAWVYSEYPGNFVTTMLRLAGLQDVVRVVDDQTGTPTYAGDLAQAIIQLAGMGQAGPTGLYHYAGATTVSRYDFAKRIYIAADAADFAGRKARLEPLSSAQFNAAARRPGYSALDCRKISALGLDVYGLEDRLGAVVQRILRA